MNTRYFLTVIAGALTAIALVTLLPGILPNGNVEEALGAPATEVTFQKNLIPLTDSLYTLGTTTKTWLNIYTDEVCLAGDCKTAWPTGGAGGGSNWLFNGSRLTPSTTVGIGVFSSSTISDISSTNATTTNATSTNLYISGKFYGVGLSDCDLDTQTVSYDITTGTFGCGDDDTSAGAGSGTISTSTNPTIGDLAYWNGLNTIGSVATGTLTETATGLEFSATRGLVGGASILSLTSGFNIPLTASTTNWNTFYDTPSNRITDGTGLTWSSNTLNVDASQSISTLSNLTSNGFVKTSGGTGALSIDTSTYLTTVDISANTNLTGGLGLTLTGDDMACDTASTSIFGCLASTDWNIFNNKLASTSIDTSAELDTIVTDDTGSGALVFANTPTLAGLVTLDYASTTGISGTNLNFTNATSTTLFSALGNFTNLIVNTLATFFNVVVTGLLDVGAGVLEIPNGTDPTVDSVGETAVNTSTSSIRFHDGTAERQLKSEWAWGSTLASSSLSADGAFGTGGTTTVKRAGFMYGVTHTEYYCRTNVGNVTIVVGDGTASSSPVRCTETGATTTASNGAFNAREMINLAVGSADGNPLTSDIYFDATARWTTD